MRWRNLGESSNVEDRRGTFGMRRVLPVRGKASALVVLLVMVAGYYGIDLTPMLTGAGPEVSISEQDSRRASPSAADQELARFTSVALKTTEDTWETVFKNSGLDYVPAKMVLYTGVTETACGYGKAAMGPFYCPADQTVYLDLAFYDDMRSKMGGGGDFALGYVLAHEVGHHVQHLLGMDQKVRAAQSRTDKAGANRLSVMMELQADCYAGVWGHTMQQGGILEPGDLAEALNTASAIGDDRLQRQSTGRVVPDSFTHGTSQQRYSWFKRGFDSGNPQMCNTFDGNR
ncbi:MAG: neutral zinc metallopeptidase [Mailhella sp.]|nr:neutral zinc metallopeptidase [Mailhella sp.]